MSLINIPFTLDSGLTINSKISAFKLLSVVKSTTSSSYISENRIRCQ